MSLPKAAFLQMPEPDADGSDTTDLMVLELKTEAVMLCGPDLGEEHDMTTLAHRQVSGILMASAVGLPSSGTHV